MIVLDLETYFSDDYTLKKLTTEEYVRDPRFEALCVAVYEGAGVGVERSWVPQESFAQFWNTRDWSQETICCHHAQFDGLILAHHYGAKPKFWIDTLSMARLVLPGTVGKSLGALAEHFGLPSKTVPYDLFKGRRWEALDENTRRLLGEGAMHDAWLTAEIAKRLLPLVPAEELYLIDQTIRMFTEPALVGDIDYLTKFQETEFTRKNELLMELGVRADDLQSADKFCKLLEAEGVEVEFKTGKNGRPIPAIAKTDDFMKELLDVDNDRVRGLVEARLDAKSTIDETRAGRLNNMASRGAMCVYLTYSGAHTHRDSGGDKINWQNFKRSGGLKKGVRAPKGYLIADPDSSQIECRVLNTLAGQETVLEAFRQKRDIYSELATKFYCFPVDRSDPERRGVGKQLELSCGFGAGEHTIIATAKRGTYGPPVHLTLEEGVRAKTTYRSDHPAIAAKGTGYWAQATRIIAALAGTTKPVEWGPMIVETGIIHLPNGTDLFYPDLSYEEDEWRYSKRKNMRTKLYGGKLTENVVQALARIITFSAAARICKQSGLKMVNREHDKLVFLVPDDQYAEQTNQWLQQQMCIAPDWLPNIPLAAEGTLKETLG